MPATNSRHAVYVGSFDPVTLGHEDLIRRGAEVFETLTVGVGINPSKSPLFSVEERIALLKDTFRDLPGVQVQAFDGLAVDFVRSCDAKVMLRGLRTLTDIEAEFTMSLANHVLAPELETVFLMSSEKYTHISSSLIKQIAQMGGDGTAKQLENFVPAAVIPALMQKLNRS